jgi:hypothetical protein
MFVCLQRQLDVQGYQVSADRKFVLFRHNVKPVKPICQVCLSFLIVIRDSIAAGVPQHVYCLLHRLRRAQ